MLTATNLVTNFALVRSLDLPSKGLVMARINTAVLIAQAAVMADRANFVRQDPAVVKAAKQARADFAQAGRSAGILFQETRASLQRADSRSR